MSLNQIYYDPTKAFEVSSSSNIKANKIKCIELESEIINTSRLIATNLNGVVNINNAPYQPGALPAITNNNDLLMIKNGDVVWSSELKIGGNEVTFQVNSNFYCYSTNVEVKGEYLNIESTNILLTGTYNFSTPSIINYNGIGGRISLTDANIECDNVTIALNNASKIIVNSGIVDLTGTSVLNTPKILFPTGLGTLLKFYGEFVQQYKAYWSDLDNDDELISETEYNVYYTRIGKMVNMTFKGFEIETTAQVIDKFFVLKPSLNSAELGFFEPNPTVISSCSIYVEGANPTNIISMMYIDEKDIVITSGIEGKGFTINANKKVLIGGYIQPIDKIIQGGATMTYFRNSDA